MSISATNSVFAIYGSAAAYAAGAAYGSTAVNSLANGSTVTTIRGPSEDIISVTTTPPDAATGSTSGIAVDVTA